MEVFKREDWYNVTAQKIKHTSVLNECVPILRRTHINFVRKCGYTCGVIPLENTEIL
jgi:hypothetical protein